MADQRKSVQQRIQEGIQRKMKKTKENFLLARDNLRFKSLAQYRAINDGDVMRYELIENNALTQAAVRGLATRHPSIEDFQAHKDNDYFMLENLSLEGSDEFPRDGDNSDDVQRRREQRAKRRQ